MTVLVPSKRSPAHAIVYEMMEKWHDDGTTLQEHMFNALYDYALKLSENTIPEEMPLSTNESANKQAQMIVDTLKSHLDLNFETMTGILEKKLSKMKFVSGNGTGDERYDPNIARILGDTTDSIIPVEGNSDDDW